MVLCPPMPAALVARSIGVAMGRPCLLISGRTVLRDLRAVASSAPDRNEQAGRVIGAPRVIRSDAHKRVAGQPAIERVSPDQIGTRPTTAPFFAMLVLMPLIGAAHARPPPS